MVFPVLHVARSKFAFRLLILLNGFYGALLYLSMQVWMVILFKPCSQTVVEARKNGLVGSPVLAPVRISMVTQSAWTPPSVTRPVVVLVTWCCRTECVWSDRSVAANTPTALLMV